MNEKFCILSKMSLKFESNWQAIFWINADPVHSRIYAALGGDGLTNPFLHMNVELWMINDRGSWIRIYISCYVDGIPIPIEVQLF